MRMQQNAKHQTAATLRDLESRAVSPQEAPDLSDFGETAADDTDTEARAAITALVEALVEAGVLTE